MNISKVRRLRTFLHYKCVLAVQQRSSKLSKDFMGICSHVALLHFVLVNSIYFLLLEMQVPGWDVLIPAPVPWRKDALGCVLPWTSSCVPLTHFCCSLWPLAVTGAAEHLSQKSAHQCPKSETEAKSTVSWLLQKG